MVLLFDYDRDEHTAGAKPVRDWHLEVGMPLCESNRIGSCNISSRYRDGGWVLAAWERQAPNLQAETQKPRHPSMAGLLFANVSLAQRVADSLAINAAAE